LTDLILMNANVVTLDQRSSKARIVAVKGSKIITVGSDEDLKALKKPMTNIIDCQGKTILPGFIDPHLHIFASAESLVIPHLDPRQRVHSISDIQSIIRTQAVRIPKGVWIRLKGYHEFYIMVFLLI